MTVAYIGIGSNHEAETNLKKGVDLLREQANVITVSPVYESASVNNDDAASYLNAVMAIETEQLPEAIKLLLVDIENKCGRVRFDSEGNKSKEVALDFDLLLYGDAITDYGFNQKTYHVPHGDIVKYSYVAVPLAHIAADVVHPETEQTIFTIAIKLSNANLRLRKDVELT
ncbi:MAG: 2-amino-4-hydroxy-6-hydroxymethyldihydropteridine diphosphokinase [Anaerolineae bacterium]|nr:2-amino-4-hydroxy-6-hydroxymethyldihydropteridine diphosphokinase [Anaerolineae bacterium]